MKAIQHPAAWTARNRGAAALIALCLPFQATLSPALAQGTVITYQAQLQDAGIPAHGDYDLRFTLYSVAPDPVPDPASQVGPALVADPVPVTHGLFNLPLDFGPGAFDGTARWLRIEVRPSGSPDPYTALTPATPITATPHAIHAGTATALAGPLPNAQLSGTYTGLVHLNNPANTYAGDGSSLSALNATQLASGTVADARLSGNIARLDASPSFLGNVQASGDLIGARLNIGPSHTLTGLNATIAGGSDNTANSPSSTVGGGAGNSALAEWATIGGGQFNGAIQPRATVSGGGGNSAGGNYATVSGGWVNNASADYAAIGGGGQNESAEDFATVAGGSLNQATGFAASIGGGRQNTSSGGDATVAGGFTNDASGGAAAVGGGVGNSAIGLVATVPGGASNLATDYAFAAGYRAKADDGGCFVWADQTEADFASTGINQFLVRAAGGVGIGLNNPKHRLHVGNTLGDNPINFASQRCAVEDAVTNGRAAFLALAGESPLADRVEVQLEANAAGLGIVGTASADPLEIRTANIARLTISSAGNLTVNSANTLGFGSATRQMLNLYGTVYGIGVQSNTLYYRSDNDFSWHRDGVHSDTAHDPGGGSELMRLSGTGQLDVNGNVVATAFILSSDRAAKQDIRPVDPDAVLEKVAALPVSEWEYKADPQVRHLGPMAQDFSAAFGLGPDDRHIATVDADGVALVAIQGLNRKLERREAALRQELASRSTEIAALKEALAELQRTVEGLNREGGGR